MNGQSITKKYYPFLDGLRAIAAMWVLGHHIDAFFNLKKLLGSFYPFIESFLVVGYLGVDVFFVISGFLITGLLLEDFSKPQIRLKRFYLRRIFKIIPQYWALLLAAFIFASFTYIKDSILPAIPKYLFFYQNYSEQFLFLNHTWSIAIEEHFYLVYPLLIYLICYIQKDESKRKSCLMWTLLALIVGGSAIRFFFPGDVFFSKPLRFDQMTHYRIDALMFGCLLKLWEPRINLKALQFGKFIPLACSLIGIGIFFMFVIVGFDETWWLSFTFAYAGAGLILIGNILGDPLGNKVLCNKHLMFIGKNSYGLYLWHYFVLYFFLPWRENLGVLLTIVLCIIFSFLVGIYSTKTIENYFLNMRNKLVS